ncbi:MAG: transcription factor FapR [Pelotomaculum sp.]
MPGRSTNKKNRQRQLRKYLEEDPFLTDEDLAGILSVSVQTIRLDRQNLHIPELRERVKSVARGEVSQVRTLVGGELVGELIDLDIGSSGTSIMPVTPAMTMNKTSVARGHHIFAQANSLAIAVIDAEAAVTGSARVRYSRPVYCGEKILAKALIKVKKGNKYMVNVTSEVNNEIVFKGRFLVFAIGEEGCT